jgi:hypothetical protein
MMRLNRQDVYFGVFYWACAAMLWMYMSANIINMYGSWYITTACVCVVAALFLLTGILKAHGLVRSSGFIIIYYLYLLLTAMWAEYPDVTIWYVLTESINIIIFALFYLLSMNFEPDRIINFFVNLLLPAILIYLITYMIDPEAQRLGGYVLVFLPFVLLFCTMRLIQSFSIRHLVFIAACLLMLVASMSRAPLLIAGLGLLLMYVTITKHWSTRCKLVAVFMSTGFVLIIAFLLFQPIRLIVAKAIVRITYQDMVVDDEIIEAEMPDTLRWSIYDDAVMLYKDKWLFGMGYMNFMPWHGDMYNFSLTDVRGKETVGMNLHNTFQTWALEGGLPCLGIATLLLWKYFSILRKRIRQSKNVLEKSYYKLFVIVMICLLVQGVFHQIHQAPIFYIFLGIVYSLDCKKRDSGMQTLLCMDRWHYCGIGVKSIFKHTTVQNKHG